MLGIALRVENTWDCPGGPVSFLDDRAHNRVGRAVRAVVSEAKPPASQEVDLAFCWRLRWLQGLEVSTLAPSAGGERMSQLRL